MTTDDRDRPSPDWKLPPEPPLHRAARRGDLAEIDRLIAEGADINERADLEFDNGELLKQLTPLMVAARSIDGATVETLRRLVDHGANIHLESSGRGTAAWYAAGDGGRWHFHRRSVEPGQAERLQYLLDQGADVNGCADNGSTLVNEACRAGDPERLQALLERGAPVTPGTPASNELLDNIQAMIDDLDGEGIEFDVPVGTSTAFVMPLFSASQSGNVACVQAILAAGLPAEERDNFGSTPLMVAGSEAVVDCLLNAGADLHTVDQLGRDALASILEADCTLSESGPQRFEVARAMIERGSHLEIVRESGAARLQTAAFGHHADAVEFLLACGAAAGAEEEDETSALHAICWQGQSEDPELNAACERIIDLLVGAGADPNFANDVASTPMHDAAQGDWGNETAIRLLLKHGAIADPVDDDGDTPLMLAAADGQVGCVRVLLEAGASPDKLNDEGHSAIELAEANVNTWKAIVEGGDDATLPDEVQQVLEEIDGLAELGGESGEESHEQRQQRHAEGLAQARETLALLQQYAKRSP